MTLVFKSHNWPLVYLQVLILELLALNHPLGQAQWPRGRGQNPQVTIINIFTFSWNFNFIFSNIVYLPPLFWIFYLPPKLYDMCLCGAAKFVNGFIRWIGKINYVSQWIFGLIVSKRMPFDVQFFIFFPNHPKILKNIHTGTLIILFRKINLVQIPGHLLYCLGKSGSDSGTLIILFRKIWFRFRDTFIV